MEKKISKLDLGKVKKIAEMPMLDDSEIKRVDIIMIKFNEEPKVIDECISRIVHNTTWPYKITIFDNRLNPPNTSKIWNKLIRESTCDYILMIDTDAFIPTGIKPCWLTRMMEHIDYKGMVLPVGDNVGGSNKASGPKPYGSVKDQNGIFSGYCFLIKKSLFDKVGWFDERFCLYGQDSEFGHRMLNKVGGAEYREDVFVKHLGGYSAKKAQDEGAYDVEADKMFARSLFDLIVNKRRIKQL